MKRAILPLLAALSLLASGALLAQSKTQTRYSFDGCTDRQGKAVSALADNAASRLVESRTADGKTLIAYNQTLLPRLLPESRLFLFAHQCARHQLGLATDGNLSVEEAKRADCQAVAMLRNSKLIEPAALDTLAADLQFSAEDWALLPGPARDFDLTACKGKAVGGLAIPAVPESEAWNRCVAGCGSKLYTCGRSERCQQAYDQCNAACKP